LNVGSFHALPAIVSNAMELILASASPRRAELLSSAGFAFRVVAAEIDETPRRGEAAGDYAMRMAHEKADAVRVRVAGAPILAADTVVIADGEILGKPADDADACRMLSLLSGSMHLVQTGVVLLSGSSVAEELCTTRVHVRQLRLEEIAWYVASGEPAGKAGAYAIQGRAARFIECIEGSWSNVVGLPIATVHRMLKEAAIT
jgi:septum formation protein